MYRIGELWSQSRITVADEHLATAVCQRVLASLYASLHVERVGAGTRVLLACVEGQHHAMGLRMVADVLEGAGHAVVCLGGDVPTAALLSAVDRHEPDVVGLSITMPSGAGKLEEAIYRLQNRRPDLPMLLGGQAVPQRLWEAGGP